MSRSFSRSVSDQRWIRVMCDAALAAQDYRCKYCDSRLKRKDATADHYRAKAEKGTDSPHNIVAACSRCNVAKGSMHGDEFRRLLKKDPPSARYQVRLCASLRRIELASQAAQRRVLALVGMRFER